MTIAEQLRAEGSREGWEKGLEEGLEKGREEGIHAGLLAAKRAAVLRSLRLRHGGVPARVSEWIQSLDSADGLDALLEAAICTGSMQEFEMRLQGRV